jgi:hypothetical protein
MAFLQFFNPFVQNFDKKDRTEWVYSVFTSAEVSVYMTVSRMYTVRWLAKFCVHDREVQNACRQPLMCGQYWVHEHVICSWLSWSDLFYMKPGSRLSSCVRLPTIAEWSSPGWPCSAAAPWAISCVEKMKCCEWFVCSLSGWNGTAGGW